MRNYGDRLLLLEISQRLTVVFRSPLVSFAFNPGVESGQTHILNKCLFFIAQGQQGNGNPCGPQKVTCHSKASCVSDQGLEQCRCNDGYQGDGTKCEGLLYVRSSRTLAKIFGMVLKNKKN